MARMTFIVLLVLAAVCATMVNASLLPEPECPEKCGKNEVWNSCGNACREPKCGKWNEKIACPAICQPRCECKEGLLRNNNGKCVEPCDC